VSIIASLEVVQPIQEYDVDATYSTAELRLRPCVSPEPDIQTDVKRFRTMSKIP